MELQDILLCTRCIHDHKMIEVVHKMFVKYMCYVFFSTFPLLAFLIMYRNNPTVQ